MNRIMRSTRPFDFTSMAFALVALLVVQRRRLLVDACLGGLPGACCSPNVPTCNNPCPQAYVPPSHGSYGGGYSSDSYGGGDSYGSNNDYKNDKHGSYGSYDSGYGNSGNSYGSSSYGRGGGGYGGGSGEYASKSSYNKAPYAEQPYAAPLPLPLPAPSYSQVPYSQQPSYGSYGQQSYGNVLPPPAYAPPMGGGITYSNALQPYTTLAAADQQPQQSALSDGYVNVGEPTVYSVPQRGPWSAARKAAGKKILTVTTLSGDETTASSKQKTRAARKTAAAETEKRKAR